VDGWITDRPASERYPIYTRANAGEVIPDPMSPLTATLDIQGPLELGWQDNYQRTGTFRPDEIDRDRPCTTGTFGGYFFLNMSMTRIFGVRCPGMTPEMVDLQYFGTMPGIPPYEARPEDDDPGATARLGEWLGGAMAASDLPEIRDLRDEIDAVVARRPPLSTATDAELVDWARSLLPHYRRVFDRHLEMSALAGVGIGTVAGVCQALGRPELVTELIAGTGDVDSAAPSWALWDLSRQVAASPALTTAFDAGVDGLLAHLQAAAGDAQVEAFLSGFSTFLDRFGSRGPDEWELRSHTWGIRPELALAAVERMRLAPEEDAPAGKLEALIARRAVTADAVRVSLAGNDGALGQFEAGLRMALLFSAGRERTKTANIKLVHEQRLAFRELGRRMVDRGELDDVDQIFMLTADELDPFVAGPTPFVEALRRREVEYRSLFDLEPPFVVVGSPPPLDRWPRRDRPHGDRAASGTVLRGIAGSPGRATGRARIIHDPSDPTALAPGDVLVTPSTDPSWTPLFVPAAAVVVDVGAQITHAVIVSRELGIPCVVSVTDATHRLADGALVEVDGGAGTVTVL